MGATAGKVQLAFQPIHHDAPPPPPLPVLPPFTPSHRLPAFQHGAVHNCFQAAFPPASASEKVCVIFRALAKPFTHAFFRRLPPKLESQARATFLKLPQAATSRSWPIISRWTRSAPVRQTTCNLPLLMPLNCSAGVGCLFFRRVFITASTAATHPFTSSLEATARSMPAIFC